VVDVNVLFQFQVVVGIHDESRDMAETVTTEWVESILAFACWYTDFGCRFQALAVEQDLLDALVRRSIRDC